MNPLQVKGSDEIIVTQIKVLIPCVKRTAHSLQANWMPLTALCSVPRCARRGVHTSAQVG